MAAAAPLITVAANGVREAIRRRVVAVVAALTVAFLGVYSLAANFAFDEARSSATRSAARRSRPRWRS